MNSLAVALDLYHRGFQPVPVKPRDKRPIHNDWQSRRYGEADLPKVFTDGENVGILLGSASDNTVDIDLDHPKAAAVVRALGMPKTLAYHRGGRLHLLVRCDPPPKTKKFTTIRGGSPEMVVEVRSDGCQSVAPGSVHPCGEPYEWLVDVPRAEWADVQAVAFARDVATACLLADHWRAPERGRHGARHQLALAAAGFLARRADDQTVLEIVEGAASVMGDHELHDRRRAVLDTLAKVRQGIAVVGLPTLAEFIGEDDARALVKWWPDEDAIDLGAALEAGPVTEDGTAIGTGPAPAGEASDTSYPLQSLGELVRNADTELVQLVEGIIWAQRVIWAFSAPNVGKTMFLEAAAMHIAAGKPFCGRRVAQGPVLFIEEDSPLSVLAEYTEYLADLYGFDLDALPIRTNTIQGLRLLNDAGLKAAIGAFEAMADEFGQPPAAVFLDAAERIVPSDKFSTRELDYLTKFVQYAVGRGSTVVVIDHTKRPQMFKGKVVVPDDPMELLYGARAKSAISDVMMYFSGALKAGGMTISFPKFRGETPEPVDVSFTGDEGFGIGRPKPMSRTPTEQKIIAWFNNVGGLDWYWLQDIISAANVPERSGKRAIAALTKRRMLERGEAGPGQAVRYRLNGISEVFE